LGVARLDAFLRRHRRIALDTPVFIYQLENNPRYTGLTDRVFSWLESPGRRGVASTITMTELLVQPYREGDQRRVDEFYGLLSTYPNLEWIVPRLEIAAAAARIRAAHGLRTPDALEAATAIQESASGMITNDPIFKRLTGIEAMVLDDIL
jgi:predicted nucleic acid-binding protein